MHRAGFAVGRVPRTRTGRLPASRCPKVGCPICCPHEPNHSPRARGWVRVRGARPGRAAQRRDEFAAPARADTEAGLSRGTRAALGFATLDLDRQERQGLPEVVYGPGELPEEIKGIVLALLERCTGPGAGDARRSGRRRRRRGRSRC